MRQVLVYQNLLKKIDVASLKSNVDKLDIYKLKNVPTNLSSLNSKVDKLNIDKLAPVSVDLSKLSNVVKNDVVKKDIYNAKIKNIEDKIPDITNLNEKNKGKIRSITITALTAVENKIPNVSNLVKKN